MAPPLYCRDCAAAYPWTERALRNVEEVLRESGEFSEEETADLVEDVRTLAIESEDSGDATLAASRFKRAASRLGSDAYGLLVRVAGEILSQTAKNQL